MSHNLGRYSYSHGIALRISQWHKVTKKTQAVVALRLSPRSALRLSPRSQPQYPKPPACFAPHHPLPRAGAKLRGRDLQRATNDICIAPRLARCSAVFVLTWDCIAHFPIARWQTSCLYRIAFLLWVNTWTPLKPTWRPESSKSNKRHLYSASSCTIWRSKHGRLCHTTWGGIRTHMGLHCAFPNGTRLLREREMVLRCAFHHTQRWLCVAPFTTLPTLLPILALHSLA